VKDWPASRNYPKKEEQQEVQMLDLLKSRKFWIAIATLVADIVVASVPQLAEIREELIKVITTIGMVLIGSIAVEDFAYWFGAAKEMKQTKRK